MGSGFVTGTLRSLSGLARDRRVVWLTLLGLNGFIYLIPLQDASRVFILAALSLLSALIPLLLMRPIKQMDLFDIGGWFAVYYFGLFGLRALYDMAYGSPFAAFVGDGQWTYRLSQALFLGNTGILCFWAGYSGETARRAVDRIGTVQVLPKDWALTNGRRVVWSSLLLGWSARYAMVVRQAGSPGVWLVADKYRMLAESQGITYFMLLGELGTVAVLGSLLLWRRFGESRDLAFFLVAALLDLAYRLVSGSRAFAFFLLLQIMVALYLSKEISWKRTLRYAALCGGAVLLGIAMYPVLSAFRAGLTSNESTVSSLFIESPANLFQRVWSRQHGLDVVAVIMDGVPARVPYMRGYEVFLISIAWIPRALWEGKPVVSLGKILRETFFPTMFHEGTAVATTIPGALYWECGWVAVLAGMYGLGVSLRALRAFLDVTRHGLSAILVMATIFPWFVLAAEQNLVSLVTRHIPLGVLTGIVAFLMGTRGRKSVTG